MHTTPACEHCNWPLPTAQANRYLCRHCEQRTHQHLTELPALHQQLRDLLVTGQAANRKEDRRRTRADTAPAPCDLTVLDQLTTPVLASWQADWCQQLDWDIPHTTTLATATAFLTTNLPWAAEAHPGAGDFATEIRDLRRAAATITDPPPARLRLGQCPALLDDGSTCGAHLTTYAGSPRITCEWCRATWDSRQWLLLGAQLHQAA